MMTYRQLIRQAQRGEAEAAKEIIELFDRMIIKNAWDFTNHFPTIFPDTEEAQAIGRCAMIEGIYDYDLTEPMDVPLYFTAKMNVHFLRAKRAVERQDKGRNAKEEKKALELQQPITAVADRNDMLPLDLVIHRDDATSLVKAIHQLTRRERELLTRKYEQGQSLAAIARAMGLSRKHVSAMHSKALQRLHRILTTLPREDEEYMKQYIGKPWKEIPQEEQQFFLKGSKIKGFLMQPDGSCSKGYFWFDKYGTYVDGASHQAWNGMQYCNSMFIAPDSIVRKC